MRTADLKIEDVAFGGKGVARENGKAVFVPFTIDGETVSAEIVREKKKFAEAEVVAVREPSPDRVQPECPYFGRCGGCSYQHVAYEHQLAIKWRQVRDVLQRIGKLTDIPMRPIIPSPLSYHYRNRITVHVEEGAIGFFRRDSHRLIDIEQCPIAQDEVNRALAELRASRPREGHYTLRAAPVTRVFTQANDAVAASLRELLGQLISAGQDLLIDAYCGAGFFAQALLDKFEQIIGIDWDRFAIEAAKQTASSKETYIAGDVEMELNRALEQTHGRKTVVIVDPPATGLTGNVREALVRAARIGHPARYVSADCGD
jgi:tRNA/tmRNA/rRNA uracil-C5-methylase (TrmA/RlmC/RlmD family)